MIYTFHGICDNSCTGGNSLSTSTFTAFLDWLQPRSADGTVVRTVGQVMGAPVPPSGPSTSISCNDTACSNNWYRTTSPISVALTATGGTGALTTRYTTDGSDPITSPMATTYAGPFDVSKTTTVRYYTSDDARAETPKSQQIRVDAAAPSVALTSPAAGTYRRNTSLTVEASATDNGTGGEVSSGVAGVVFRDGSTQIGIDTTAPYRITWRSNALGNHSLTAVVTDVAGNSATSAPVVVNIRR